MPEENKYDSGHVVLPVYHAGEGEVHNLAVPEKTALPQLHDALLDGGYHFDNPPYLGANVDGHGNPKKGPDLTGSIEHDPKFKAALQKVWETAAFGKNSTESGTYVGSDLERGPVATSNTEGRMSLSVPQDAPYTIHSHPNHAADFTAGGQPSDKDIATAKSTKKYVYVVSRSGLQYVGPHGEQGVVYTNPNQFK